MTTAKELRAYSEWAGRPPVLEIAADMLVLQAEEIAAYAELRSQDIKQFADLAGKYAAQQKRIAQLEAALGEISWSNDGKWQSSRADAALNPTGDCYD